VTINLTQFPSRIFEDVYLTKTIDRRGEGSGGRVGPKKAHLLLPKAMVEEQGLQTGKSYICKIKRLSDAYCEDELLLTFQADDSREEYPMIARFPDGTGFKDGEAVYVKAKPFDLEKWFRCKTSKGFDTLASYEEAGE